MGSLAQMTTKLLAPDHFKHGISLGKVGLSVRKALGTLTRTSGMRIHLIELHSLPRTAASAS